MEDIVNILKLKQYVTIIKDRNNWETAKVSCMNDPREEMEEGIDAIIF